MEIKFRCLEIVWRVSAEHVGIYCNVVNDILRLKLFSIQKRMSEIQSPQIETMHCNMFEEENSLERPSSSLSQWVEINSQLYNFCIVKRYNSRVIHNMEILLGTADISNRLDCSNKYFIILSKYRFIFTKMLLQNIFEPSILLLLLIGGFHIHLLVFLFVYQFNFRISPFIICKWLVQKDFNNISASFQKNLLWFYMKKV